MIHIFIHCNETKQRHTERKNAMTMAYVGIYLCILCAFEWCRALSVVVLRLDLSCQ